VCVYNLLNTSVHVLYYLSVNIISRFIQFTYLMLMIQFNDMEKLIGFVKGLWLVWGTVGHGMNRVSFCFDDRGLLSCIIRANYV